jgi:thiosulfate/3-mercaptopyruvate sulfurtransferase
MKKSMYGYLVTVLAMIAALFMGGCGSSVSDKTQTETATYAKSALLVSTTQLAASLDSANQVVIDVRSSSAYSTSGHIRNAVNLPPGTFDKGTAAIDMDLKSPAEIAAILGNAGISINTRIIVCGQNVDASAGRVFWMLEYLGAKDVHMLDGGYDKWVKDGYPTVTVAPTPTATTFVPTVDSSRLATKASVLANYNNTAYVILDSRNVADYNPGYIPNAVNVLIGEFLNADNTVKSNADLTATLESKGITPGKTVITYCYVGYRSGQEYFILRLMGYDVSNYDGSWTEWNADPTPLPRNSRPNGNLLISGESLAATIDNANQAIIDVRSATDYAAGHIRNAVNLPPGTFDKGTAAIDMDLKSPAEIAAVLGAAGVSSSKKIIVYGKNVDANAGRVFWLLEYSGARDVHVLDGGYDKWVSDLRATVTTATAVTATTFTPATDSSKLATKSEVLANYGNTAGYAIVDSRNAADYTAKRIPNAINILIGDFLNADNTVKSYTDLKTLLDGLGVTTGKTVITHCYVGYRSGQEYLVFRLMGFNVSNYDGSWTEWNADPTLPTVP